MMALAVALVMMLAMGITASAATITINRDSSWDENAENADASYTYYKIFDAQDISGQSVNAGTGAQNNDTAVAVYTISGTNAAAKVAALPSIFTANLAADGKYYITTTETSASTIATALKAMVEDEENEGLFPGTTVTSDDNPVVISDLAAGYYLLEASNGSTLVVQTLDDVTINEKNDYPTVTKEQKKAADSSYTEAEIPAEIGTYVDYKITVHIPVNANKDIVVVDKMSAGLQYDSTTGLTLAPNVTYTTPAATDAGYDADATWQIKLAASVVEANQDSDIVITYRALITEDALTDTDRENEVTLTYDDGNYILKDNTEYTTYFGGIEKVDGSNHSTKLEGVKFELTVGDDDFLVSQDDDGIYYPDPTNGSNEVETDENGLIIIRGLDNTKTYTLTETETNTGYNLLETPHNLVLAEDEGTAYTTATFDQIENNKGTVLPSTGGIGTTIFYVIGAVLVIGAGILLVTRRRMNNNK